MTGEFRAKDKCPTDGCWLLRRWDCQSIGQAYLETYGNWPFQYGEKGGRCSPTDLDGIVFSAGQRRIVAALERNDNLVVIENKHVNEMLPDGQRILFEALCRKGIPVLLQTCRDNAADEVVSIQWWYCNDAGEVVKEPPIAATRLNRDELLHAWWKRASRSSNRGLLGVAA